MVETLEDRIKKQSIFENSPSTGVRGGKRSDAALIRFPVAQIHS
jgi:hypothetical protein